MDWFEALIGPDNGEASPLQLCVRAVIILVFGIACIRIAGRRTFSQASPLDIIVAIIVGSNLSRAMTGKAPFIAGLAATLLLVVLHRLLAWATLRWGLLSRWIKCDPVVLVRDGVRDERAMRVHGISEADLLEGLRMEQMERVEQAHLAMLEGGGKISVVPMKEGA
ncbi:uncharacterized membrane protein YcaP (DUF421 family) [Caulobacter ginsengisoli]|uniref:Uncharacterized membrane protein YcaP (DUF421 family) n=1 Tax=Caulobacter ginsengisoli TaxID=400775 RepID=A0ABU0IQS0_9CAUL|nr:YetF domain-containing protein [Caulobacter ginsengisoli]MDQ0464360.1 uncharacterized membrane protein YcaP (DUF421 family) [Caulobacter ginsengisoli]